MSAEAAPAAQRRVDGLPGSNARVVKDVSGERRCNRALPLPRVLARRASSAKPNEVHREGWVIFIQRRAALRGGDKDKARWRIAVNVARYLVLSWQQKAPVAKATGA
jgi:hypothetical protein